MTKKKKKKKWKKRQQKLNDVDVGCNNVILLPFVISHLFFASSGAIVKNIKGWVFINYVNASLNAMFIDAFYVLLKV